MFGKKKDAEVNTTAENEEEDLDLPEEKHGFNYILYIVAGGYGLLQGANVFKNIVIDHDEVSHPAVLIAFSVLLIVLGILLLLRAGSQYVKEQRESDAWERLSEEEAARSREEIIARSTNVGDDEEEEAESVVEIAETTEKEAEPVADIAETAEEEAGPVVEIAEKETGESDAQS